MQTRPTSKQTRLQPLGRCSLGLNQTISQFNSTALEQKTARCSGSLVSQVGKDNYYQMEHSLRGSEKTVCMGQGACHHKHSEFPLTPKRRPNIFGAVTVGKEVQIG